MEQKERGKITYKKVLAGMVVISTVGVGACTIRELNPVAEQGEVEFEMEPDTTITNDVQLNDKAALDAVLEDSGNREEDTVHNTVENMPILEDEKESSGAIEKTPAKRNTNPGKTKDSGNSGNESVTGSGGNSGNHPDVENTGNGSASADTTLENSEEPKETEHAQSAESSETSENMGGVVGNTVDDLGNPGFSYGGSTNVHEGSEVDTGVTPSGYWTIDEEGNQIFVPDN